MSLDTALVSAFVEEKWPEIQGTLEKYIEVPSQSPAFDPEWETNGLLDKTVGLFVAWVQAQGVAGLTLEVVKEPTRTPLILIQIPATSSDDTVLMYGHLDKQPPMAAGWVEGLGPYTPVVRDGKLYGRGGADDGYAVFAAITAIGALRKQGLPHARAVVLIEASEESGSPDLPYYVSNLRSTIGTPSLIVCLDSGCGNYDQLWVTTSLRGMIGGTLRADILTEAVHSGSASGVVPSSFRIARSLLSRVEDVETGEVKLPAVIGPAIPPARIAQASVTAGIMGDAVFKNFPFVAGAGPTTADLAELLLRRTWRPALSVTGAEGFPALAQAGNVLRTGTALKLSMRVGPRTRASDAAAALKEALEASPPYGAKVSFEVDKCGDGWDAPEQHPWLTEALERASQTGWGKPAAYFGEGGSIPFMGMLGELFPAAQFVVTGVLGPASNAHGPNEFLHIAFTKRIIGAVAFLLAEHAKHPPAGK